MIKEIKKVAVLGAGVMGSGIAAHLANAGIPSYLLDIVPKELTEEEKKKGLTMESPEFRNRLSEMGKQNAIKARPAALYTTKDANLITCGNFEDNMDWLKECEWIIEVVVENLKIKQSLFERVEKYWNGESIISSNTSGISIKSMVEGRSLPFRQHFLVTHFFNPVRYMRLLEIIAGEDTLPEVVRFMAEFGENRLGKGIVYGKDTPNFIANRIGVYGLMATIHKMMEQGYTIEEVDTIVGQPMGRPKTAAFKTADLVGIDTFVHVAKNTYEALVNDPAREVFQVPEFISQMVEKGLLGNKTKAGFYKKEKGEGEEKSYVLDYKTLEYVPTTKPKFDAIGRVKNIEDVRERLKTLVYFDDRAGKFAWEASRDGLLYTIQRVGEIADDIINIDNAMKWGFNWELGPFEAWDAIGVRESVERMQREGIPIPDILQKFLEMSEGKFYKKVNGKTYYFDFKTWSYQPLPERPKYISLKDLKDQKKVITGNLGATLIDLGDGVACLEFHTKMNAIDDDIIRMIHTALDEVEKNFEGLVLGNQGENFSVGANLMLLLMNARQKKWGDIEMAVRGFQNANMRLRYSPKPTVAAPFGMTLGGGCEVCMACDKICASTETYMGLVEIGAGVIPAGSGTKELLVRNMEHYVDNLAVDPFPFVRRTFETIGMAKVSFSGPMAVELGYMKPSDHFSINKDHLLYDAKNVVLGMVKAGYKQPRPRTDLKLPGRDGYAALKAGLYAMMLGKWITEYEYHIGSKLAWVVCGGDTSPNVTVSEQYILDLECEAFLSLCGEEKTLQRMEHLLLKGKPLRN